MGLKNMIKGSGILMAAFILLLGTYYMVRKTGETKSVEEMEFNQTERETDPRKQAVADSITPVPELDVAYLTGRFDPSADDRFTEVDARFASRKGMFLRQEAYEAFIKMRDAASKDGIVLTVISATRNFNYQKSIWESKWNGSRPVNGKNLAQTLSDPMQRAKEILKYSSMPGTSRHHWGTDMDLNSVENKYFETASGKKLFEWLTTHAHEYGFCRPYTAKGENRPTGFEEEKWHWSYLPLSKNCMQAYKQQVRYTDLTGFKGSETAEKLHVIEDYVMGVSESCR
jgi:zinc D-Ala-D-Ala carboxypeptidase